MDRRKDAGLPDKNEKHASQLGAERTTDLAQDTVVLREYGPETFNALTEMVRLRCRNSAGGARTVLVRRRSDHTPGLVAESLIIKVGENVSRVAGDCKRDHPGIPWALIEEMRNRLTHLYEPTDYGLVWDTIETTSP